MKLYNFPSKFIFQHNVENHEQLKDRLLDKIIEISNDKKDEYLQDHDIWDCKVITSFFDPDSAILFNENDIIYKTIWKAFDDMLGNVKLNSKIESSKLNRIWFNVYEKGHSQEVHQHCGSDFSGVYILHCTEPNKTVFYSNENHRLLNKTIKTEDIEEGTILIFPSHLCHYVNEIQDDLRVTVAFNITCEV